MKYYKILLEIVSILDIFAPVSLNLNLASPFMAKRVFFEN